jgi:hypothetical protein
MVETANKLIRQYQLPVRGPQPLPGPHGVVTRRDIVAVLRQIAAKARAKKVRA